MQPIMEPDRGWMFLVQNKSEKRKVLSLGCSWLQDWNIVGHQEDIIYWGSSSIRAPLLQTSFRRESQRNRQCKSTCGLEEVEVVGAAPLSSTKLPSSSIYCVVFI